MSIAPLRPLVFAGLEGTPMVLARLTTGVDDARLDLRPDPDRFTIREVAAHLAEYDVIFLSRMRSCLASDLPDLVVYDPGQLAIDNDYAHAAPAESAARLAVSRLDLLAFLNALTEEQWERTGSHTKWGKVSIADQVDMVHAHDALHMRQIAEWLAK